MFRSTIRRRAGAGVAAGALAASALLFAPSAHAATEVTVTNADVLPTASVYTSWHQGYAANPTGAKVTTKGLELSGGPSQVLKGYADNDTTIGTNKNFDILAKITGSKFTAIQGVANLQIEVRGTGIGGNQFATLRSASDEGSRIKTSDLWETSKAFGDIAANTPTPLTSIVNALGDYKVIGFGVQAGTDAVVSDITWDGVTYRFKEPVPAPIPVPQKLKGKVDIYRVHPSKISVRSTVSVYVTVKVDGKAAAKGSTVYGYAKGKKVATGKVNSSGKVKLTLPVKLPAGKSTLKVTQAGSSKLSGGSDSVVVRVRK